MAVVSNGRITKNTPSKKTASALKQESFEVSFNNSMMDQDFADTESVNDDLGTFNFEDDGMANMFG